MIRRLFGSLQVSRFLERFGLPDRSANNDHLWRESLREMARHFPPSGTELRLLNIGDSTGRSVAQLLEYRPDLSITGIDLSLQVAKIDNRCASNSVLWIQSDGRYLPFADNSFDAIAAHGVLKKLSAPGMFLDEALRVLRPGGRLILLTVSSSRSHDNPLAKLKLLVDAGFARVLSEKILDGYCGLSRGEKPYTQRSTVERIAQSAARDNSTDSARIISPQTLESAIKGKFVYLLVHQLPDKPAWALKPNEPIRWRAAMVNDANGKSYLLAFSSLNKAVEFMQVAVTNNSIQGINKVAKYPKNVIGNYATDLLLNPTFDLVREPYSFTDMMLDVDPHKAVTGEE